MSLYQDLEAKLPTSVQPLFSDLKGQSDNNLRVMLADLKSIEHLKELGVPEQYILEVKAAIEATLRPVEPKDKGEKAATAVPGSLESNLDTGAAVRAHFEHLTHLNIAGQEGKKLAQNVIHHLYSTILLMDRNALLNGISPFITTSIPNGHSQGDQLLIDLSYLNNFTASGDGTDPFAIYLMNALGLLVNDPVKYKVVWEALQKRQPPKATPAPRPAPAPAPVRTSAPKPAGFSAANQAPQEDSKFNRLSDKDLDDLLNTVIRLGQRPEAFLIGIDRAFVASSLPEDRIPLKKLRSDLEILNATTSPVDGKDPLRIWLKNAVTFAGPRVEAKIFEKFLAQRTQ